MIALATWKNQIPFYLLLVILIMGAFGVMGGGLVAPGLPAIGEAFNARAEQLGLVLSIYTLSAALSLPVIGYLLDLVGPRKVGLVCLFIDGTAGVIIPFVPTFNLLLILRFIQGIGIAGLIPVAMTLIGHFYEGERRLKVMGYLSATISMGAVFIPTLGGFLATFHWRYIFFVYGFSLILACFFLFSLPKTRPSMKNKRNFVIYLQSLFRVLKKRDISIIMLHSLLTYFLLYTLVTFLPIFLVMTHGFSTIFTGLSLSIYGLFSAILSSQSLFLAKHLHWRKRITIGFSIMAICFLLLPFWPEGNYLISISLILFGTGMGILSPTIFHRATQLPPPELRGSVIAIFNTMKYLGMTLSPLLLGLFLLFTKLSVIFLGVGVASLVWGYFTLTQKAS